MAVELLGAGNDRLDFGDLAAIAGDNLSIAFTLQLPGSVTGSRLITQWGSSNAARAVLLALQDTDEIACAFRETSGGTIWGRKSTDSPLVANALVRVVIQIAAATPSVIIWVNGVVAADTSWFAGDSRSIQNVSTAVQVGHESAEGSDGIDGDYSEIALWDEVIPDWMCRAYGAGFSPRFMRTANSILYVAAVNTSFLIDEWEGNSVSQVGAADAAHPRIFYPAPKLAFDFPAGGGDVTISAVAMSATALSPDAGFSGGVAVDAQPMLATALSPAGTFSGGATLDAQTMLATALMPEAAFSGGAGVVAVVMPANALMPDAVVLAGGDVTIAALVMAAIALSPDAGFSGGVAVQGEPMLATALMPVAVIRRGMSVGAQPMLATVLMPSAVIRGGAGVAAAPMLATALMLDGTLSVAVVLLGQSMLATADMPDAVVVVAIGAPAVIHLLASYNPAIVLSGSYNPAVPLRGSYNPNIPLEGHER